MKGGVGWTPHQGASSLDLWRRRVSFPTSQLLVVIHFVACIHSFTLSCILLLYCSSACLELFLAVVITLASHLRYHPPSPLLHYKTDDACRYRWIGRVWPLGALGELLISVPAHTSSSRNIRSTRSTSTRAPVSPAGSCGACPMIVGSFHASRTAANSQVRARTHA